LVRAGDKLPADSLVLSTKNIWSIIKSQKDLNLPAHKVRECGCGPLPVPLSHPARGTFAHSFFHSVIFQQQKHLQLQVRTYGPHACRCCLSWLFVLQVMVANIRCAEIMKDQLANFTQDQAWAALQQESSNKLVRDFGTHAGRLLDSCLKG
jgi:hypothetical protein